MYVLSNHGKMKESVVKNMYLLFLNPLICLFISLLVSFMHPSNIPLIIPILCATICASLMYVFHKKHYRQGILLFYMFLCILYKEFLYYLPVVVYMGIQEDVLSMKYLVFFIPFLFHLIDMDIIQLLCSIIAVILAYGLKIQYLKSERLKVAYRKQRDATQELALVLSAKNRNLMIQQEQEIRIATLDERNRIAREIHDNVGHLLSSSLLQIGALQVMTKEETTKESLTSLRETISTAMDSVRKSVHDLHEEALDLKMMIQKLIAGFTFCDVMFEYDVIHPFKQEVIYHIAAVVKECLNNTMKHSNATKLSMIIREQPAFYQIIVNDNGTKKSVSEDGIGLHNIRERVESLHGYVNITTEDGFRVFITLPKEEQICEC